MPTTRDAVKVHSSIPSNAIELPSKMPSLETIPIANDTP